MHISKKAVNNVFYIRSVGSITVIGAECGIGEPSSKFPFSLWHSLSH